MMRIVKKRVFSLAAACLAVTGALVGTRAVSASGGAGLQPLPGLREEVVLEDAILNDRRLDLNRFADRRSPEALRDAVRALWAQRPAPVHAFERDGWLVLVQAVGASIEVMEVRARGSGAEGRRSRLSRAEPEAVDASAWLEETLPAGSRVLRRITHRDGERGVTTLVAISTKPAGVLAQGLLARLGGRGFRHRPRGTPSFGAGEGSLQFLARGNEELALTISEQDGERAIVMHWGRTGR